jgi:hypothetical protein
MEWLILLLVVPAILGPVVLLGGFAGCGFEVWVPGSPPSVATNLEAVGVSTTAIELTWVDGNMDPVTFQVERSGDGETFAPTGAPGSTPSFVDTVAEGAAYFYRVRTTFTDHPDLSALSEEVRGSAFGATFTATLTTDQSGLAGWCLVQRIEPAALSRSGTRLRIFVRGSSVAALGLARITVSEAAAPGAGDLFDSVGVPTTVALPPTVPAGTVYMTPTIDYVLDRDRPLLVAFEVGTAAGNVRYAPPVSQSQASLYFKAGSATAPVAEALTSDRSGYTLAVPPGSPGTSTVYLVERIEVA